MLAPLTTLGEHALPVHISEATVVALKVVVTTPEAAAEAAALPASGAPEEPPAASGASAGPNATEKVNKPLRQPKAPSTPPPKAGRKADQQ